MTTETAKRDSIGVVVIGGGMAGRAHAAGYRTAGTLFGLEHPDVRLVAIADADPPVPNNSNPSPSGRLCATRDAEKVAAAPPAKVAVKVAMSSFSTGAFWSLTAPLVWP